MRKLNVLVADDEAIIRLGLKKILEEAGHAVSTANDGAGAVRIAEDTKPDLVILDIKMPEMDGISAARAMLDIGAVPIIFLTAYGERELIERAVRLPVMGYLVKPVKEAELLAMLELSVSRFEEHARVAGAAARLEEELGPRRIVDRAKGLLMRDRGISELEAYDVLQRQARTERRTLQEVAEDVASGKPGASSNGGNI